MKILMAGITKYKGGKETYMLGMYRELLRLGCTIDFLSTDPMADYQEEILQNGSRIFRVTPRSRNPVAYVRELAEVMKKDEYDVFWSHRTALSSIEEFQAAKRAGIPVRIIHCHNSGLAGSRFTKILHEFGKRRIRKYATDFFACSEEAAVFSFGTVSGVKIWKNAFNIETFSYNRKTEEEVRRELGIENAFTIGHVGRFSKEKNHEKILRVFAEILKKMDGNSILLLCGDGPERAAIGQFAQTLGISESVKFLETRKDPERVLQAFDVLLFPSVYEGMGYALLEAQAAGVPCVISEGVPEGAVFSEHVTRLSLAEDDKTWAEACIRARISDKGENTNSLAEHGFSIKEEAEKMDRYLTEQIGNIS